MIKNITIPQKLLSIVNKDIFQALTDLFGIKFKNHADIFRILRKNPNYRSQIFDLINMLPALNLINYEIKKKLEKNILKKTLINWTYPQIRFDDILSKKFSAPAHKDRWVIDKDKTGYIVWIPLKKGGANLLVKFTRFGLVQNQAKIKQSENMTTITPNPPIANLFFAIRDLASFQREEPCGIVAVFSIMSLIRPPCMPHTWVQ